MKRTLMALIAIALVLSMLIPAGAFAALGDRDPTGVPTPPTTEKADEPVPAGPGIWNYYRIDRGVYEKRYCLTGSVYWKVTSSEKTATSIFETLEPIGTPVDAERDVRIISRCKNETGHTGKAMLEKNGTITVTIPVY